MRECCRVVRGPSAAASCITSAVRKTSHALYVCGQTKICQCQSEEHFEDIQEHEILSEKDYAEYQKMCETDEGRDKAEETFHDRLNPVTKCSPFYFPSESTRKYDDKPTWTCKVCSDKFDGSDYDCEIEVSCDMEIGE